MLDKVLNQKPLSWDKDYPVSSIEHPVSDYQEVIMTRLSDKVALVTGGARGIGGGIALGRAQTVVDIAHAVIFLCEAPNITGASLTVDGGYTML